MVGLAELVSPDTGQNENGETLFEVRYLTHRFAVMPTIKELRQVPVVGNASFLKSGPATTVLKLTHEQGEALYQFLSVRNPDCARIWPDIAAELPAHLLPDVDGDFSALEGASGRVDHLFDLFDVPAAREAAYATMRAMLDTRPLTASVPRVSAPTLVVWGRSNRSAPVEQGRRLARELGGARFEVFDCGRSPAEECPEAFTRAVVSFLANDAGG